MNILVTAGNTQTPVDKVRCITNIFSGRTGARVAARAFERGHAVTLLTSHPEVLNDIPEIRERTPSGWRVITYRTFDDLEKRMAETIRGGNFDVVIHAAAVSDYYVAGVYSKLDGKLSDVSAGKVKSHHAELWLRLVPTPKLVDKIRAEWGFSGTLVKFKLEVGLSEQELIESAENSRIQSSADLMTANTLEGMYDWAYLGSGPGSYRKVSRTELADRLIDALETR